MENALQIISKRYVSMDEDEVRTSNVLLDTILSRMVRTMRRISPLFDEMFEKFMYGGSFYDGLKVGKPNEFDIDLVLKLPTILDVKIIPTSQQGFVNVYLKDWKRFTKDKEVYSRHKDLEKFKDSSDYLLQEKVLRWMQQTVALALNICFKENIFYDIPLKIGFSTGGPAVTLHIEDNMDIDLVAVFRFSESKWPESPFRPRPSNSYHTNFYVVPKAPKSEVPYKNRCWRLSFQEQEQNLLTGFNFCKPALRLLKKLRDTRDHNIPSYFIKTIFLWKVEESKYDYNYWSRSLSTIFMEMLSEYKSYLDRGEIPYYWNKKNNLLQYTKSETIYNIRMFLQNMINTINIQKDADPYIIAKFLLKKEEYMQLRNSLNPVFIPESAGFLRSDNKLYEEFEKKVNDESSFSLFDFLVGAALIGGAVFLSRSNP